MAYHQVPLMLIILDRLKKAKHVVNVRYEKNISVLPNIPASRISQYFNMLIY